MGTRSYTAIVEKEGASYVALCPELDVASQGETVESATANLKEAVELFLECADPAEVESSSPGCSSCSDVSGGCERKRAKETSGEHSCLQLSKSWKVLLATGNQISCRLRIPANVRANLDSDD